MHMHQSWDQPKLRKSIYISAIELETTTSPYEPEPTPADDDVAEEVIVDADILDEPTPPAEPTPPVEPTPPPEPTPPEPTCKRRFVLLCYFPITLHHILLIFLKQNFAFLPYII